MFTKLNMFTGKEHTHIFSQKLKLRTETLDNASAKREMGHR